MIPPAPSERHAPHSPAVPATVGRGDSLDEPAGQHPHRHRMGAACPTDRHARGRVRSAQPSLVDVEGARRRGLSRYRGRRRPGRQVPPRSADGSRRRSPSQTTTRSTPSGPRVPGSARTGHDADPARRPGDTTTDRARLVHRHGCSGASPGRLRFMAALGNGQVVLSGGAERRSRLLREMQPIPAQMVGTWAASAAARSSRLWRADRNPPDGHRRRLRRRDHPRPEMARPRAKATATTHTSAQPEPARPLLPSGLTLGPRRLAQVVGDSTMRPVSSWIPRPLRATCPRADGRGERRREVQRRRRVQLARRPERRSDRSGRLLTGWSVAQWRSR